jgi:predicted permease
MNWFQKLPFRFRALFQKEKLDARMDDELRSHIEMQTQENIEAGMKPEEARYAALRQFGWVESIKDDCRDQRGSNPLANLAQDIRYAARMLRKNPGFTMVAVLTLALGIGANTAMFSFVNAILLRSLPYDDPDRLVMLFENHPTNGWTKMKAGASILEEWRRQASSFENIGGARSYGNFTLTGRGQPEVLRGSSFSANLFPLLGLKPILGRGFLPHEETLGNNQVVVLGYDFWQRRFGGDTNVLGQSLTLAGTPNTVIGVMPKGTVSPDGERDVWTPLAFAPFEINERHSHNFSVYARLKAGVTLAQARAEMEAISRRLAEADANNRGWSAEVYPLHEIVVGNSKRLLLLLLGAVGLVLLIACANIAGLLLARSAARTREFSIRAALGARRSALIRQLLTESCLLAVIGGALGILIARVGLNALIRFSPPDLPRMSEGISLEATTLGFTALITLATGVFFGLIPALQSSNPALARNLAETTRGSSGGTRHQSARAALVVAEVAVSLVLLVGATLTIRSFARLLTQNLGFVPEHLVTMTIGLPPQSYPGQAERTRLFDSLMTEIRNLRGIESAGYAFGVPLTFIDTTRSVMLQGAPPRPGEEVFAGYAQISPGYFATIKASMLQGRDFTDRDDTNTPPVVIVDQTFAKKFALGTNVIGRRLDIGDGTQGAEIVGMVQDIKRTGMADGLRGEMYRPYRQICWGPLTLVVRTTRDPEEVTRAIRSELDRFDKDLPLANVRTMSQLVSANVAQRRLSMQLLGAFAGGALLLSTVGLYGVMAYTVTQRTREIGIRAALGAQRTDLLGMVMAGGMKLAALGIVIGLVGSVALTRLIRTFLFEVAPTDSFTFIVVPLVLATVSALACWLPAQRAANTNPIVALRYE